MIKELAERFVVGKDIGGILSIWNDFYYDTFWGKGAGAIFYAAVSALEQALWDIKGQALGVPVYELLGGKQREVIPIYANGWSEGKCICRGLCRARGGSGRAGLFCHENVSDEPD